WFTTGNLTTLGANDMVRKLLALIACVLASACASAQLPTAGGWIGVDPTLHVSPELERAQPTYADALEQAAAEYCERGYRCVRVVRNSNGRHQADVTTQSIDESRDADRGCEANALACSRRSLLERRLWVNVAANLVTYGEVCSGRLSAYALP